jgi:hypothetical protein
VGRGVRFSESGNTDLSSYRPPGTGANVDPLGDVLMPLLPDGFSVLFAPAAALPAPVLGVPAAPVVPLVVPVVGDPAAGAPVEPAPGEPVPLCASANVLVSVSAAANAMLVSLMVSFLLR